MFVLVCLISYFHRIKFVAFLKCLFSLFFVFFVLKSDYIDSTSCCDSIFPIFSFYCYCCWCFFQILCIFYFLLLVISLRVNTSVIHFVLFLCASFKHFFLLFVRQCCLFFCCWILMFFYIFWETFWSFKCPSLCGDKDCLEHIGDGNHFNNNTNTNNQNWNTKPENPIIFSRFF